MMCIFCPPTIPTPKYDDDDDDDDFDVVRFGFSIFFLPSVQYLFVLNVYQLNKMKMT